VLVTVAANQPIAIGFDAAGDDFVTAATLTLDGSQGARTLVVRSQGGQELRFTVAGNSANTSTAVRVVGDDRDS
jgi:hypothetical protein